MSNKSNIITNIYSLPIELSNTIFRLYWEHKFDDVLTEILHPKMLEQKIKRFINTYCIRDRIFDNVYLHYLKLLNTEINTLFNNNNVISILLKNSNLTLYWCKDVEHLMSINNNLKRIAAFCISYSPHLRYHTLNRFQQLSTIA
jgi:hypothetical protein